MNKLTLKYIVFSAAAIALFATTALWPTLVAAEARPKWEY
jgi:hypothetical protein